MLPAATVLLLLCTRVSGRFSMWEKHKAMELHFIFAFSAVSLLADAEPSSVFEEPEVIIERFHKIR